MLSKVAFFHSCTMSERLKSSITQKDWFGLEVEFISMNSTVEEYRKHVLSNKYHEVFIVYDGMIRDRESCVRIYNSKIGVISYTSSCSSVIMGDILGSPTLNGLYGELLDCYEEDTPCICEY